MIGKRKVGLRCIDCGYCYDDTREFYERVEVEENGDVAGMFCPSCGSSHVRQHNREARAVSGLMPALVA